MAADTMQEEREQVEDQEEGTAETDGHETAEGQDGPPLRADGKPMTSADVAALREALTKARKDARSAKRTAKDGSTPAKGGDGSGDQESAPNADEIRREIETAAEAKYKPMLVRQAARAAFAEAGLVTGKNGNADAAMKRVIRLLDLDDLDVDEDGSVDGLDEQIAEIKQEFPDLFGSATGGRRRTGSVDGADKSGQAGSKVKSSAEALSDQLFGRGR